MFILKWFGGCFGALKWFGGRFGVYFEGLGGCSGVHFERGLEGVLVCIFQRFGGCFGVYFLDFS